jgi:heme/copper-type cytochrome/quinol oxidase subunit 2
VNGQSVVLQYDAQGDHLTIKRDSCHVNKTLYNTMVLGSVTLLIFFISAMVVEKKRHEKQDHEKQDQVGPNPEAHAHVQSATTTASLMWLAHIFAPLVPPHRPSRETQAFQFEQSRSKSPFAHHT